MRHRLHHPGPAASRLQGGLAHGALDAGRHRAVGGERFGPGPRGYCAGTPRRSACTTANTAPTTRMAPATSRTWSDSPSTSAPRAIATTGFTYWCVTTV